MRRWELTLVLDSRKEQPLFLQLAARIAEDIRRGRLKPGDALPGSRELAAYLGVNRNTVIAGYGELIAEGLLHTRAGSGTFVAGRPRSPAAPHHAGAQRPSYPMAPPLSAPQREPVPRPGLLALAPGGPDVRLFPARALARAFGRAIGPHGRTALGGGDPRGHLRLRRQLAEMLARSRGLVAEADDVLVTRSIEQGLDLVARVLVEPGDTVVVESLGYPPAREVMRLAGARLRALPVDREGLDVASLETLLQHEPVRAVLVTPHHQFPTTVVMSPARRARLAELALRHRFAIVEDDYDHEFHYHGDPVLPIAAGPAHANVIYVASMANLLAPGLGTGFVAAPPAVLGRLAALRASSDAQGDAAVECAIAELFEDGELLRHVRRTRKAYARRRDALAAALRKHLGGAVQFHLPEGGMAIWARAAADIDTEAWMRAGECEGVLFRDSQAFDATGRDRSGLRLGFAGLDTGELEEAVRRMARALPRTWGRANRDTDPAPHPPRTTMRCDRATGPD